MISHLFPKTIPEDYWLIYLVIGVIALTLIVLAIILLNRLHYVVWERRREKFRSTLLSLLSAALNYPEKKELYRSKIKKLVRNSWQNEMLLDELVTMCYNFQGVYKERSQELYDYFDLRKISNAKLKSTQWNRVIEGVVELSIIGSANDYKSIIPLLDHPNIHVRRQVKIAIVEMGKVKGLMEMEARIGIMSSWTFISILSILHRCSFKLKSEQLEKLKQSDNPAMRKLTTYLDKYSVAY